jgi:1,4-alpha-glucan branching enzyme
VTCQQITDTCGRLRPDAIRIAEYWPVNSWVVRPPEEGGAGFDATWHDGLRDAVRAAVAQSVGGKNAYVEMGRIAQQLEFSELGDRWRAVNCVENHDVVRSGRDLRMARLADFSNSRSWYARSRSRVATGLLLTAPGIPLLFMGQEFLEDKQWNDYPDETNRIAWEGLESSDRTMVDFLRFTSELIALRRRQPGLRGEGLRVFWVHDIDRVLAFQRWVEGVGQDVVVVASLNESTFARYDLGFPGAGRWLEVFNSDVYDNWVNPTVAGNGGSVEAWGPPMHGMPVSATVTVPANSILVFARER